MARPATKAWCVLGRRGSGRFGWPMARTTGELGACCWRRDLTHLGAGRHGRLHVRYRLPQHHYHHKRAVPFVLIMY